MKATDFDFPLPGSLIATEPAPERDGSRLLVLGKDGGVEHRVFRDVVDYLEAGDMLLLNRTRVLPVRLAGLKATGGRLDVVLVRNLSGTTWEILSRGKYTGPLHVSDNLSAYIRDGKTAELHYKGELEEVLLTDGQMPLPPYIKRAPCPLDRERYQTVYASEAGSIAAPTAGLHFTKDLLRRIEEKGVLLRYLTLHVGRGTFAAMRAQEVEAHHMEKESFEVQKGLIEEIGGLRGKLVAVGTTTTRALEGLLSGRYEASGNGAGPGGGKVSGATDIFIYPGYRFKAVRSLITNFHLPRSTPLMLASALAGRERLLAAYAAAVRENYRFFSYGDAMLIL